MPPKGTDISVSGGPGSTVYLMRPESPRGRAWMAEKVMDDGQRLGEAYAVEWRYVDAIVDGARADGLTIA